jgi:hypothetical protein
MSLTEVIKEYERKPIEIGYDWQSANKGWCRGFILNSECYTMHYTNFDNPERVEIMKLPIKYVSSINEPNWKVNDLERELIASLAISNGELKEVRGIPLVRLKPLRE